MRVGGIIFVLNIYIHKYESMLVKYAEVHYFWHAVFKFLRVVWVNPPISAKLEM